MTLEDLNTGEEPLAQRKAVSRTMITHEDLEATRKLVEGISRPSWERDHLPNVLESRGKEDEALKP